MRERERTLKEIIKRNNRENEREYRKKEEKLVRYRENKRKKGKSYREIEREHRKKKEKLET